MKRLSSDGGGQRCCEGDGRRGGPGQDNYTQDGMASAALRPGLRITAPMLVDKVVLSGKWAKRDGGTAGGRGGAINEPGSCSGAVCLAGRGPGAGGWGLERPKYPHALSHSLRYLNYSVFVFVRFSENKEAEVRPAAQLSGALTSGIFLASACRRSSNIRDVGSVGRRLEPRLEPRHGAR